jgi:hypothetical protein
LNSRHFFAVLLAAFVLAGGHVPALAAKSEPVVSEADAAAAKAKTKECLDCHDDPKVKTKDGKSMQVVTDDFRRSAHRKVDCVTCHEAGMASKHPDEPLGLVKPQVCQECHEDELKAIATSIHGKRAKPAPRPSRTARPATTACTRCTRKATRPRRCRRPTRSRPVAPATKR